MAKHKKEQTPRKCPTPAKLAYTSERRAIWAALGSSRNFAKGTRWYKCPCTLWHVTTQPKKEKAA